MRAFCIGNRSGRQGARHGMQSITEITYPALGGVYILDWNGDEDRCTIRTGHGPAKITALRRFAIGAIKAKSRGTVAATIQRLARNVGLVFDYLGMTENSRRRRRGRPATAG